MYLLNQGAENAPALAACPATSAALRQLPVMTGCALGYAFFSSLAPGARNSNDGNVRKTQSRMNFTALPGSAIAPHTSASNLRLRCHLPLRVPGDSPRPSRRRRRVAKMRVGGRETTWREWTLGRCTVFDDSFEHEVTYTDYGCVSISSVMRASNM